MARARKPIQENADGRFRLTLYNVTDPRGKNPFIYLGRDRDRAKRIEPLIRRVTADLTDCEKAVELAYMIAKAPSEAEEQRVYRELTSMTVPEPLDDARRRAIEAGVDSNLLDEHPELIDAFRRSNINPHLPKERKARASMVIYRSRTDRRPHAEIERDLIAEQQAKQAALETDTVDGELLSACYQVWYKLKSDKSAKHHSKFQKAWNEFCEFLNDKPIAALTKTDIADWIAHLKEIKGDRTNKWFNDCLQIIRAIIDTCLRWSELPFPEGISKWTDFRRVKEKYIVKRKNNKRLPNKVFADLLAKADEWAGIDVKAYADKLPIKKTYDKRSEALQKSNNVKQAKRVKRDGMQFRAILRYAATTAADNSDICLITWGDLKLNDPIPHVELVRNKTKEFSEPRYIPLLPSTISALLDWREYEEQFTDTVFRNDGKKPWASATISKAFDRLKNGIKGGDGWNFKHLRKMAPQIGRDHRRQLEERDAILGHKPKGMTREHYEDMLTPEFLVPLVNCIGAELFGGEKVAVKS